MLSLLWKERRKLSRVEDVMTLATVSDEPIGYYYTPSLFIRWKSCTIHRKDVYKYQHVIRIRRLAVYYSTQNN